MKKLILFTAVIILGLTAIAQPAGKKERRAARRDKINALIKQEEEGVIIYHKHNIFGLGLATDGYGLMFEKGWKQDKKKTRLLRLELYEKKHPKEDRVSSNVILGAANSFIYAKLNNFFQFRAGYGQQRLIGSKGNKNGIEVSAVGIGGLSLGLLKPYLYDVRDTNGASKRTRFDPNIPLDDINGASGVTTGWNEVKIQPGAFLRTGLRFEYGRFNEVVSAVEVGVINEFYASKIAQVYEAKQRQHFFSGYVTIQFGRRK